MPIIGCNVLLGAEVECGLKPRRKHRHKWDSQAQHCAWVSVSLLSLTIRQGSAGELPPGAGSFYKTRLCHMFEQTGRCSKGSECRYAHGAQELRTAGARCMLSDVMLCALALLPVLSSAHCMVVSSDLAHMVHTG